MTYSIRHTRRLFTPRLWKLSRGLAVYSEGGFPYIPLPSVVVINTVISVICVLTNAPGGDVLHFRNGRP